VQIFIENRSGLPKAEVQAAIDAINAQIEFDFLPAWDMGATLVLRDSTTETPDQAKDAVIYLTKQLDVQGALGYHALNDACVPFGYVATELSAQLGEDWTVTLSHEALELILDAIANITAKGQHPTRWRTVFYWYEACDAVQNYSYKAQGTNVFVSNFVLPPYFTPGEEKAKNTNFLAVPLKSFGVAPGGYVGFYDPLLGRDTTYVVKGDQRGASRLKIKSQLGLLRRGARQELFTDALQKIKDLLGR